MRQQHWTDYKISLMCVCQWVSQSVSQSVNFGTPSISQERLKLETSNLANRLATGMKLETSNLARRLATGGPKWNNAKVGQKGSWRGHVTYFLDFGTPFISRDRLKLEASNLAGKLATGGPKRYNAKLGQKGSWRGHVTYFLDFETPFISGERLKLETLNLAYRLATGGANEKMQN